MSTTTLLPPENNRQLAENLTEKLGGLIDRRGEWATFGTERHAYNVYSIEKTEVYSVDVENQTLRFAEQLQWLEYFGLKVPCASPQEFVPIPVSVFPPLSSWGVRPLIAFPGPDPFYFYRELLGVYGNRVRLVESSVEEAIGFFKSRLIDFLTARFSARRSDISSDPGMKVTVSTRTHGLRVHYSPAYFFDPTNVLNAPTSPVSGWIQPGRYMFGAGVLGRDPDFDFSAEYDIPPHTQAHLAF